MFEPVYAPVKGIVNPSSSIVPSEVPSIDVPFQEPSKSAFGDVTLLSSSLTQENKVTARVRINKSFHIFQLAKVYFNMKQQCFSNYSIVVT
jgi:hypothetical protein